MRVVIIGGSHAGIACALRAREEYPDAEIVLYEKQDTIGFVAQSIPLFLLGVPDFLRLRGYTNAETLEAQGIVVRTETVVRSVSTAAKEIRFMPRGGEKVETDRYDKLVLATGSYPSIPLAAGEFHDQLLVVKNYDDAVRIKDLTKTASSIIVIGGGAIGVEIARVMILKGIKTILLQAAPTLLNRYLDDDVATEVRTSLEHEGLEVHTSSLVVNIQEETRDGRQVTVVTTKDGHTYTADGVIYATGFRPNTVLLGSQVTLGHKGAVVVDDYMQTSVPDVFAVGDCSTTHVTHIAEPVYVPHASDALRKGQIAAVNLTGPKRKLNTSQGTYNLNFGEQTLCVTGLSLKRARHEGYDAQVASYQNDYVASEKYYKMWMVYERGTHKILGIQVRGTAREIASYADIASLAIEQGMTIEDLEYSDFYFKHGYRDPHTSSMILADIIRTQDPVRVQEPVREQEPAHVPTPVRVQVPARG